MSIKFAKANEESRKMNEDRDCTVISLSIAGRLPYAEAHAICAKAGRRPKHGMRTLDIIKSLDIGGFNIKHMKPRKPGVSGRHKGKYTPKTIGARFPKGHYICLTANHAFAMINGVIHDWMDGRQHRITDVIKVVKPHKKKV